MAGVCLGLIFSARAADLTAVEAGSLRNDGNLSYRFPGVLFNWVGLETNNLGFDSLGVDRSGYYERRNYFRFNLPTRPADPLMRVKQAVLILEMTSGSFNTPQEFETLVFRQASAFTFDALGTGLEFGRHKVDTKSGGLDYSDRTTQIINNRTGVRFTLNNKAVFAAHSKLGTSFDLGGALDPLSFNYTKNGQGVYFSEYLFDGSTSPSNPGKLELTIGENTPPTVSILTPATVDNCEVTLDAAIADAERDVLTVTWSEIINGTVTPFVPPVSYTFDPDSTDTALSAPPSRIRHLELGPHTLQVVVSDVYGGQTTAQLTVNVVDQTAPIISSLSFLQPQLDGSFVAIERLPNAQGLVSPGLILEATNPNGEMVTDAMITAHAWDDCDPNPTILITPPLPDVFPLGTKMPDGTWTSTEVRFQATDATGIPPNRSSIVTTTVTVVDTTAPVFVEDGNYPMDKPEPAQSATGAYVVFARPNIIEVASTPTLTVTLNGAPVDIVDAILCPIGPSTVVFTATDGSGNSTVKSISVTITDGPPTFTTLPPTLIEVDAQNPSGAYYALEVVAYDSVDGPLTVTTDPPGATGNKFYLIGTETTVTFSAIDSSGNPISGETKIRVVNPVSYVAIRKAPESPELFDWPSGRAGNIYGWAFKSDGEEVVWASELLQWDLDSITGDIGALQGATTVGRVVNFAATSEAFDGVRYGTITASVMGVSAYENLAVNGSPQFFIRIRSAFGSPDFAFWPAHTAGAVYGFVLSAGQDGIPDTPDDLDYPENSAQLQWSLPPSPDGDIGFFIGATIGTAVTFQSTLEAFTDPRVGVVEARFGELAFSQSIVITPLSLVATPEDVSVGCTAQFVATTLFPNHVLFSGDLGDTPVVAINGNTVTLTTTYSTIGAKTVTALFHEAPPLSATAYIYDVIFNTEIAVCKDGKGKVSVTLNGPKVNTKVVFTAKTIAGGTGVIHFDDVTAGDKSILTKELVVGEKTPIVFTGITLSNQANDILVTTDHPCKFGADASAQVTVYSVAPIILGHSRDANALIFVEGQDRVLYSQASTSIGATGDGVARVAFRGGLTPEIPALRALVNPQVKWLAEIVPNASMVPFPDWGNGVHAKGLGTKATTSPITNVNGYVTATYKGLPNYSQDFGPKRLEMDIVKPGAGGAPDEPLCAEQLLDYRLFYRRLDQDNPGILDPNVDPKNNKIKAANWYYYWSEEGAFPGSKAVCDFSRIPGKQNYVAYDTYYNPARGAFGSADNHGNITLYDPVAGGGQAFAFPLPGSTPPPADWIAFTINAQDGPDWVNLTLAHERTHRECRRAEDKYKGKGNNAPDRTLIDEDKDGVPDKWEREIPGMKTGNIKDEASNNGLDSFGNRFIVSAEGGRGKRDEEFYATLGGALGGEKGNDPYFGRITKGQVTPAQYFGTLPNKANRDQDWSKGGFQWQR